MVIKSPTTLTSDEFGVFFSEYKSHFINIAFSYVHDWDIAKDIVTDCFVYLWENRDALNWDQNIKGYVYLRVKSRCISHIREQQALTRAKDELSKTARWKLESSLNSLNNSDLSNKLLQTEILEIFREELSKMPELTRTIFQASRNDDLTYRQIAEKYHLPIRRVTQEIQRALEFLRIPLKDYLSMLLIVLSGFIKW